MNNGYPPFNRGGGVGPMVYVHHGGASPLHWAVFALLLILVLAVAGLLMTQLAGGRSRRGSLGLGFAGPARGPVHVGDPLDVLRNRYARGEIGRDEFLQATSDLTAPLPPPAEPPAG